MSEIFYIADMRPQWRKNWAITFWRPNNCGYAYPLSWAGKYDRETVIQGGDYYTAREYLGHDRWSRYLVRCAVPCAVVDALAVPPPQGKIAGNAGPVVLNTGKNRTAIRKYAFAPLPPAPAKEGEG